MTNSHEIQQMQERKKGTGRKVEAWVGQAEGEGARR